MRPIPRFFQLFSGLSLDVVVGAMASLYFFQELLHLSLEWPVFGLLGLAVWTIYSLDHLLDTKKMSHTSSARRTFHLKYRTFLGWGILVAVGAGLGGAWFWMGWGKEFQLTLILAFSMAGCRWAIQKFGPILLKEVSIALFYLVGTIWLPLLRVKAVDLSWEVLIFAVLFFVLALLNLWMLSLLDREEDRHDGFVSLAHVYPPQQLIQWIQRLSFVGIFTSLAAFILLPSFYRPFSCILLLMFLVHYLTFFQSQLPVTQKRQRMELAFWIPWLLLWI
uniref:hypothetical protein n=1 Tax=Algoriphagus sp. TaxID=1872435 RepID=UPI0040489058